MDVFTSGHIYTVLESFLRPDKYIVCYHYYNQFIDDAIDNMCFLLHHLEKNNPKEYTMM